MSFMPQKSRPWTAADEQELRLLAPTRTAEEIAAVLNRSAAAVLHRSEKLGVTLRRPTPPPGRPASGERNSWSLSTLLKIFGPVAALLSIVATIMPAMTVIPEQTEDSPTINYYFTLKNGNRLFALESVGLAIANCHFGLDFKNSLGQDVHANIVTESQNGNCDSAHSGFLAAPKWQKHRLTAGEPYTFNLSDYFQGPMKLSGGDIAFKISYTSWVLPWPLAQPKYFRFVAEKQPSGRFRWIEKPLD
jgi:hypothetical protein